MSHILFIIEHWDDPFGLIVDAELSKTDLESTVVDGFGISGSELCPNVMSDIADYLLHCV
jgi:hypothetical protein